MVWSMSSLRLQLDAFGCVAGRCAHGFAVSLFTGLDGGGEVVALLGERGPSTVDDVVSRIADVRSAAFEIVRALSSFGPDEFAGLLASFRSEQQSNRYPQSKP